MNVSPHPISLFVVFTIRLGVLLTVLYFGYWHYISLEFQSSLVQSLSSTRQRSDAGWQLCSPTFDGVCMGEGNGHPFSHFRV